MITILYTNLIVRSREAIAAGSVSDPYRSAPVCR